MKRFLSLIFIAFTTFLVAYAQDVKQLSFSEVINKEGKTQDEIYQNLKQWFAIYYKNSQKVLQYDDGKTQIIGKGIIPFKYNSMTWAASSGEISYNITLKIKDGRFKVEIDQFVHKSYDIRFSDSWSNGLVYNTGELSKEELALLGVKGLKTKQYKAVDKKVKAEIANFVAELLVNLKSFVPISEKEEEEDW